MTNARIPERVLDLIEAYRTKVFSELAEENVKIYLLLPKYKIVLLENRIDRILFKLVKETRKNQCNFCKNN